MQFMFQELENRPETNPKSLTSGTSSPWSVETEADRLMDELFSDIDNLLEGSGKLPNEPVKPDYISLQSLVVPSLKMPTVLQEAAALVKQKTDAPSGEPISPEPILEQIPTQPLRESHQGVNRYLDKILFGFAFASLLGVLWWLVSQGKIQIPTTWFASNLINSQKQPLSEADAEFLAYMRRSLEVIERQGAEKLSTSTTPQVQESETTLPDLPGLSSVPSFPNQPPNVFYYPVPVYPPQTSTPVVPITPVTPVTPTPKAASKPIPAQPPKTESQATIPTPAKTEVSPAQPTTQAETPVATSNDSHILLGLLEAGERSAALFDINGVTQRIRLGEAIGTSGWTLVSVADQKAVIRRNGDVRSVYVGNKF